MKRSIYPLYAAADEGKVRPLLNDLQKKGFTIRQSAPGKKDALLLFLSENVQADSPLADAFIRLNAGRELVIPVNLDGAKVPEELQSALMARHALDGAKYGPEELAERIAKAVGGSGGSKLPLVLSLLGVLALLVVGGLIAWNRMGKPDLRTVFAQATATPEPTPEPTAEPTATPTPLPTPVMPFTGVDPADIVEVVYMGDELHYYTVPEGLSPDDRVPRQGWEDVATGGWVDDGVHFYSKADGHEYPHAAEIDIEWLTMLPNLQYLALCDVRAELPNLSGLNKLNQVDLGWSSIPRLEGLRDCSLESFEYHGDSVEDFSPLTSCPALRFVHLDLVGSPRVDLSGFHPPKLTQLVLGSGNGVKGVDLSCLLECPLLSDLSITGYPQIQDLSFLQNAQKLERVALDSMDNLRDLSGMEGAPELAELRIDQLPSLTSLNGLQDHRRLQRVSIDNCGRLRDISGLENCMNLVFLNIGGNNFREELRDVSILGTLTKLTEIRLYGVNINNLDFLKTLKTKKYLKLGVTAPVQDFSGLDAIESFTCLDVSPWNGDFSPWAEHLKGKPVRELQIDDARNLDLGTLPQVTQRLILVHCDIRDLSGLKTVYFTQLQLVNCPYLTSLDGIDKMPNWSPMEPTELTVNNCPRLSGWSALEGKQFESVTLDGLFSLPDLSTFSFSWLSLEHMDWLEDNAVLSQLRSNEDYQAIHLRELPNIRDISPLFRLHGNYLEVGPELEEQAKELVEKGNFQEYGIAYPDGGWDPNDFTLDLISLDELETLPRYALKKVKSLTLVGDTVVDFNRFDCWEEWDENGPLVKLRDRATDEEIAISETGTVLTDVSLLAKLTGLESMHLYFEPLTDLSGIQTLENLRDIEVKYSPAFMDASAAFTVQTLERLCLSHTGLASLQGIQNLPYLKELYVDGTQVTDLSPLVGFGEDLHLVFDLPELMTFDELKAQPSFILERIERISMAGDWVYRQWGSWWIGNEDTGDGTFVPTLFKNSSDEKMAVETGHITDLSELAFLPNLRELKLYRQPITDLSGAAALPKLESIDVGYCDELTDASPLFTLENLRDVNFNDTRIVSLEGIEGLKRLTSLTVAYCEVTDMSPLEKVDYTFCMQEENGGGFNLEVMRPREDPAFTAADYAPLSAVPAFNRLDVSWVPAALWLDAVKSVPVKQLNAQCGAFTGNEELQAFVAAHPGLEEIQITFCSGLTDVSCLLELEHLRYVEVSDNMQKAIASLGEGYGFELNIRPW